MITTAPAPPPDTIVVDKPSGIPTHRSHDAGTGLLETISSRLNKKLFPVHRLDSETSGVLLLAVSEPAAARLSSAFAARETQKHYLLLTSSPSEKFSKPTPGSVIIHSSLISKVRGRWISDPQAPHPNATTSFRYVAPVAKYHLWDAEPLSGKTHQIRLHAADLGIPILGDDLYGGEIYPTLCLHAQSLTLNDYTATAPAPRWFHEPELLGRDHLQAALQLGLDRRQRSFELSPQETCRIVHYESPWLTVDKLGEVMWFGWYREKGPTSSELKVLNQFASQLDCLGWYLIPMTNRGQEANLTARSLLSSFDHSPRHWTVSEEGRRYECRSHHGWSAGLFLDQRRNRSWLESMAAGKRVLNLFSYSGGFTVAALRGGAREVVAVDTSEAAHTWSAANISLNNLDTSLVQHWTGDARTFCAIKKNEGDLFDIIILDPPTFARGKKRPFVLLKEWQNLVSDCLSILAPHGTFLFTTNCETLSLSKILGDLPKIISHSERRIVSVTPRFPDLDFVIGAMRGVYQLKSIAVQAA